MPLGPATPRPYKVFCSYAHQDGRWHDKLKEYLNGLVVKGSISWWCDREIQAGGEWDRIIKAEVEQADIFLFLVTASFLASPYCCDVEFKRALERQQAGDAVIIPVAVDHCSWSDSELLAFEAVPNPKTPIIDRPSRRLTEVAIRIEKCVTAISQGHVVQDAHRASGIRRLLTLTAIGRARPSGRGKKRVEARVGDGSPGHQELDGQNEGAQASKLSSGPLTGKTLSHYRVLEIVGGGGMGVVYRAEDLKLGRQVALKFLPEELGSDPRALARFEREARAASALEHPNICPIYEFGEHKGQPFLAMQFLKGQTLREYMAGTPGRDPTRTNDQPLEIDVLLDIAIQITDGMEAAHEKGIIHRDIKPANIFVLNRRTVKILDFGVAKLLQSSDPEEEWLAEARGQAAAAQHGVGGSVSMNLTRTGTTVGTASCMSPEQVRGEVLDVRTDLFSFGLVLYEMVTRQKAFGGHDTASVNDAILNDVPIPALKLNPEVPPKLDAVINKCLEKDRKLRYQQAADIRHDLERIRRERLPKGSDATVGRRRVLTASVALAIVAMIAGGLYWRWRHKAAEVAERGTIVLADFENTTGETVFDTLPRTALTADLEQSPYLRVLSPTKVREQLGFMVHPEGASLTEAVTREICQRSGGQAMVRGKIAHLGARYAIEIRAEDCSTGDLLAIEEGEAASQEQAIATLHKVTAGLTQKLGASVASIKKYDTPLEQVTTTSLEALKVYSLGVKRERAGDSETALAFYKHAAEIDPNFAMAYAAQAEAYYALGDTSLAVQMTSKAFELRERTTEVEKSILSTDYYFIVTGDLPKAIEGYKIRGQLDPKELAPHINLATIYTWMGQYQSALDQSLAALSIDPVAVGAYTSCAAAHIRLNQFDEATDILKMAAAHKIENNDLLTAVLPYTLAFLTHNATEMRLLLNNGIGKPGLEDSMLIFQSDTEAYFGRLSQARLFARQAKDSAVRANSLETAALWRLEAGLQEAEAGNSNSARQVIAFVLPPNPGKDLQIYRALALARSGDTKQAKVLADDLAKQHPADTMVQSYWVPTIRAAIELGRGNPSGAIELLRAAEPYELGAYSSLPALYPNYLRGLAYLGTNQPRLAAGEFEKILQHKGVSVNFILGALAILQLARGQAMDGRRDMAIKSYESFLALWKDADPDVPIFQLAKTEYAKLQ